MKRVKKRLNSVLGLFLALTMLLQPIFAYAEEGDVESMQPEEKYEVIIPISNQGTIKAGEERRVESDETQIRYAYQAGEGVLVEYWFPYDREEKRGLSWQEFRDQKLELDDRYGLRAVYTHVFNAELVQGIPELELEVRQEHSLNEVIKKLEQNMGVPILDDGGDQASFWQDTASSLLTALILAHEIDI